jgi:hypothetical protein
MSDDYDHTERDGAIRWMSDGPVLELANGDLVRPHIEGLDNRDWHANSVSPIDKYATVGPVVDDNRAHVWFVDAEVDGE